LLNFQIILFHMLLPEIYVRKCILFMIGKEFQANKCADNVLTIISRFYCVTCLHVCSFNKLNTCNCDLVTVFT
jgi:hypothetical protein